MAVPINKAARAYCARDRRYERHAWVCSSCGHVSCAEHSAVWRAWLCAGEANRIRARVRGRRLRAEAQDLVCQCGADDRDPETATAWWERNSGGADLMSYVRCKLGGPAPCFDDLCHGVDQTMCGLYLGFDFCEHGNDPELCQEYGCCAEDDTLVGFEEEG